MKNLKNYCMFLLFLFCMNSLYAGWQLNVAVALEDNDIKETVSLGVRSAWMKKIHLDKTFLNVGYGTDSGIFFKATTGPQEEKIEKSKDFKGMMHTLWPHLLNTAYAKIKESYVMLQKDLEQSLNLPQQKVYNENDVDVSKIALSVDNTLALYNDHLMTRTDIASMYVIVQRALDIVAEAKRHNGRADCTFDTQQSNKTTYRALKFYDTFYAVHKQKREEKERVLTEKIKKLEELQEKLKAYY